MTGIGHDVRYALRGLRKSPGFTTVAVLTLALGIGGSTAIFTVVNGVLLQPLRFAEPERLTIIWTSIHSRVPPAYVDAWRFDSRAFDDVAAWRDDRVNLTGRGEPIETLADRVTPNFFTLLGVPPHLGRTFTVHRTFSAVEPEVVLSYRLWQDRYGGDPAVVGQSMTLDGKSFTIIGVMPEGFAIRTLELAESRPDVWIPLEIIPAHPDSMNGTSHVIGRLARGVTAEQAQAELTQIARRIEDKQSDPSRNWTIEVVPLLEATVRDVRLALLVLSAAVLGVLLIACANVGNLVLSRDAARQSELAVRQSLGASVGRILRQRLTESLVLASVGGALGFSLALAATKLLVSALPTSFDFPRTQEIRVDMMVLVFAGMATAFSAIVFGSVPAWMSARAATHFALCTARGSSIDRRRTRASGVLIVCETTLAITLLSGAGLLGRSFLKLSQVDPGFDTHNVMTLRTTLPTSKYDTDARQRVFSRELLQRIERLPGVQAAGFANYLPLSRFGEGGSFQIEGRADRGSSWISVVGGDYFDAMGIPLLRGRLPGEGDTELTQPVFLIDQALAERYWPGQNPVGARVSRQLDGDRTISGEVVGVVGNVRWGGMAYGPQPTTYLWYPQRPDRQLSLVIRMSGDSAVIAKSIAAEVRSIDPSQPVAEIRPLENLVYDDLASPRFTTVVLSGFAAVTLLLAAIGLYGVIAYNVAQRTREVGIRMALGAQQRDVLGLVLRRGLVLTSTGVAIGVATAMASGQLLRGLLFGIGPTDSATLVGVSFLLTTVAMIATYLPARRAARVDPLVALRYE